MNHSIDFGERGSKKIDPFFSPMHIISNIETYKKYKPWGDDYIWSNSCVNTNMYAYNTQKFATSDNHANELAKAIMDAIENKTIDISEFQYIDLRLVSQFGNTVKLALFNVSDDSSVYIPGNNHETYVYPISVKKNSSGQGTFTKVLIYEASWDNMYDKPFIGTPRDTTNRSNRNGCVMDDYWHTVNDYLSGVSFYTNVPIIQFQHAASILKVDPSEILYSYDYLVSKGCYVTNTNLYIDSEYKNTWDTWHMVSEKKPVFNIPTPKTNYVDIPGADGSIDLTESLTGSVLYKDRSGAINFVFVDGYGDFNERYQDLVKSIHGKRTKAVLIDDDPDYYYEGRFVVGPYNPGKGSGPTVTIKYQLSPYKINIQTGEKSL